MGHVDENLSAHDATRHAHALLQTLGAKELSALRHVRDGMTVDQACEKFRVPHERIANLHHIFRKVPYRILSSVQYVVSDHLKLRKLIATLRTVNGVQVN